MRRTKSPGPWQGFIRRVELRRDRVPSFARYPFSIPAIAALDTLTLHPSVTFFVGENGSGKSTLLEAIAVAAGFNVEGGTKNFRFATRRSESELHRLLRISRGTERERDGFFLRAESFFNVATHIEELDREPGPAPPVIDSYGGISLHEQSHGESFLTLLTQRMGGQGLYLFDEPEAALSPGRQLSMLKIIDTLVRKKRSQLIIATHSPILLAYPEAAIFVLDGEGMRAARYEETEPYQITKMFLADPQRYFKHLFRDDEPSA
jgi:predicted ATPase